MESEKTRDEILNRYRYHQPSSPLVAASHQKVRETCEAAARLFLELPPSRERSLALTHLEEAMHWGNAAIAIHQTPLMSAREAGA